jgi:hypothetical protein
MSKKFNTTINFNDKSLNTAIDLLMNDIVYANIFNRLIKDLVGELNNNKHLIIQSNTFWYLTINAFKESRMIRLCRIFDSRDDCISMINLLEAIKANNGLFSKEYFKIRLSNNPFVESLSSYNREIELKDIQSDIDKINNNISIKKIQDLRHNLFAHLGLKSSLKNYIDLKHADMDISEIDELLEICMKLMNKYMALFKATSWSNVIVGHDDYTGLINFFNIGLKKYQEDIQKEFLKYNNTE